MHLAICSASWTAAVLIRLLLGAGCFICTPTYAAAPPETFPTKPVRFLVGYAPGGGTDVLTRVTMIGNDLKLDEGIGTCGKDGQSVPVGVGQPTLRIDGLTVGGTGGEE